MKGVAVVLFASVGSPAWCTKGGRYTIRWIDDCDHTPCRDIQETKKDAKKIKPWLTWTVPDFIF